MNIVTENRAILRFAQAISIVFGGNYSARVEVNFHYLRYLVCSCPFHFVSGRDFSFYKQGKLPICCPCVLNLHTSPCSDKILIFSFDEGEMCDFLRGYCKLPKESLITPLHKSTVDSPLLQDYIHLGL